MAERHKVRVLKLVQMPDHTHHSTIAETMQQLAGFQRDYTSVFAKERNRAFGLSGPVFETPFSSAPKRGDKEVRTNLIYLDNNPVERKLVKKADEKLRLLDTLERESSAPEKQIRAFLHLPVEIKR